jgi:hypothetical protein
MSNQKPDLRWQNLSLMDYLRKATEERYFEYKKAMIVPEKELTEKQLFNKLKKELKEVSVKLN